MPSRGTHGRRQAPAARERSLDQRIDALNTANGIRALRAQLKRDLKAGRVSIGALLLDSPVKPKRLRGLVRGAPDVPGATEGRNSVGSETAERITTHLLEVSCAHF